MEYQLNGLQGICPNGWHVPTDEEWKILEGAVDSQHSIGDTIWDWGTSRGYDAGENLKSTNSWFQGVNGTDLFSFSALPAGVMHFLTHNFLYEGTYSFFWTSSGYAWGRGMYYQHNYIGRLCWNTQFGYSVRCIKE